MTRLFCLSLAVTLSGQLSVQAQEKKKDPPKHFTNSIGMKFVWINPGSFMMGSPKEEKERQPFGTDETQHKVTLTKGFYMGIHLVTQEQWTEVMGNNPSFYRGENELPVETVSWDDCQEFAKKLRTKEEKPYRLPSEAEWEYACRAGTKTPFHFGDAISTDQANYRGDFIQGNGKNGVYRQKTTPVDKFPANAWGLYDMSGNVCQWCQDWYGEYPHRDVVDPKGPDAGNHRVIRGGVYSGLPAFSRSASREHYLPDWRHSMVGCRLCFFLE